MAKTDKLTKKLLLFGVLGAAAVIVVSLIVGLEAKSMFSGIVVVWAILMVVRMYIINGRNKEYAQMLEHLNKILAEDNDPEKYIKKCNDYIEKAIKYVRMHGDIAFSAGGSAYDVLYIIDKYGIVPEEVYTGLNYGTDKHQHGELDAILKGYVDAIIANPNKKLSTAWLDGFKAVLDTYLGKVPEKFTYNGVEYTPQSFAKSLGIKASDYVPLTSFTHHDFYKPFAIEVPDNWLWSEYYNIPLNELMETIDYAIDKGFTVMWASDVSEKGFQYLKGFAVVPVEKKNENLSGTELARWVKLSKSEKEGELYKFEEPEEEQYIDQKLRQEAFDNYETTDDHGMVFVGTAVDQNGTKYYKVKNSWGTEQIYGGFFYASEAFVKYKTMDILVHKDAVPVKILKKLHLK